MRIAVHTLGCRTNQYDTEAMLEQFLAQGYELVDFDAPADVYLVNTCTVTAASDHKSRQMIRRAAAHPGAVVVVAGCYAQRDPQGLLAMDGVDLVVGIADRGSLAQRVEQARLGKATWVRPLEGAEYEPLTVSRRTQRIRANLKIQEGCDNHCTYCIIPSVRGGIRSRTSADAVEEARRLVDDGCPELVLTGTHLASWGRDLPGNPGLADLVEALAAVPGVRRLRLGSLDPVILTQDFVRRMARTEVCPYFHVALQSGCDAVLKRMGRGYTADDYRRGADRLRAAVPGAALATDLITGFPGETEEEFSQTLDFVREMGFARIHVFPYSDRPGAAAGRLPGGLPQAVRMERARRLIALGERLAGDFARSLVGQTLQVLLEQREEADPAFAVGYSREFVRVRLRTDAPNGAILPVVALEPAPDGLTAQEA